MNVSAVVASRTPHRPIRTSSALRLACAAFLAGGLIFGLTGCGLDENKRLQSAVEQARQQLAEAERARQKLQADLADLQAKYDKLNAYLNDRQNGDEALKLQRDRLATELAALTDKYNQLLQLVNSQPALPADINNLLRDLAAQYPDLLEFDERLGMVRFKSDLTFDRGSTEVSARAKQALAAFTKILNNAEINRNEVQVVGHTDDIPIRAGGPVAARNPDNWTLSTNRAWSVLEVLRTDGLAENRGMASGWGDQRPIAANAPGMGGNQLNRRVDIYIRPTKVPEGIVVSTPGAPGATRPAPTPRPPATRPVVPASRPATAPGVVPVPG